MKAAEAVRSLYADEAMEHTSGGRSILLHGPLLFTINTLVVAAAAASLFAFSMTLFLVVQSIITVNKWRT